MMRSFKYPAPLANVGCCLSRWPSATTVNVHGPQAWVSATFSRNFRKFRYIAPSAGAAHRAQAYAPKAPGRSCLDGTQEAVNLQGRRVSKHWMAGPLTSVIGLSPENNANCTFAPRTAFRYHERRRVHSKSTLPAGSEPGKRVTVYDRDAVGFQEAFDVAQGEGDGDPVIARKRRERKDSVTETIFKEREAHQRRLTEADFDHEMAKKFKAQSLGMRKRPRQSANFNLTYDQYGKQVHSGMAAGGFARWMGSASRGWPQFKHRLPEVALAGHTNCGKSTLVNALSGIHPRRGPASTSDRAGWTDLVGFFQIGKHPPVLTLVDLPGYGHAVASKFAIKGWLRMIKEYITTRQELCSCCVLVDCTRGFCEEDRSLLRLLMKKDVPFQIVLTKADLLTPELLSACVLLLRRDLSDVIGDIKSETTPFSAVCGTSGAGITALWRSLENIASKSPGSLVALQAAQHSARQMRDKAAEGRGTIDREH